MTRRRPARAELRWQSLRLALLERQVDDQAERIERLEAALARQGAAPPPATPAAPPVAAAGTLARPSARSGGRGSRGRETPTA